MNHTKEPWFMTDEDDSDVCIFGGENKEWLANIGLDIPVDIAEQNLAVVFDLEKANARRIVACVNACEGLTQDHFDGGWSAKEIIAYASNLEKEREAYRDLCVDMLEELKSASVYMSQGLMPSRKDVNSAIIKAEKLLGEKK